MSEITDLTLVEVFKNETGRVGYFSQLNRVKRVWENDSFPNKITVDELKDLLSRSGGYSLLTEHLLIKDIAIREHLGLPISKEYLLDDQGIKDLLKKPIAQLKSSLELATDSVKERIAKYAIESNLSDMNKLDVIKEITNIDVLKLIQEKKEDEKAAKAAQK